MWISWKHEDTDFVAPLTIEQKVDVFYEQTLGWQLHIADLLANGGTTFGEFKLGQDGYSVPSIRHSGFAVLHICLSYIELVGSLVETQPQSLTERFATGARAIPGLIDTAHTADAVFARLYDGARCGLYHEGRTRPGVGLGPPSDGNAIASDPEGNAIGFSPESLPTVLKAHLEQLKRQLLDPANVQLRRRFERRFDAGFTREPPNDALQPASARRRRRARARR